MRLVVASIVVFFVIVGCGDEFPATAPTPIPQPEIEGRWGGNFWLYNEDTPTFLFLRRHNNSSDISGDVVISFGNLIVRSKLVGKLDAENFDFNIVFVSPDSRRCVLLAKAKFQADRIIGEYDCRKETLDESDSTTAFVDYKRSFVLSRNFLIVRK